MATSRSSLSKITHQGFSLMEVVVTLGVLSIVSLGAGSLIIQQAKQKASIERNVDITNMISDMSALLKNQKTCTTFLTGQDLTEGKTISFAHDVAAVPIRAQYVEGGTPFPGVVLSKIRVTDTNTFSTTKVATIEVEVQKNETIGGQKQAHRLIVQHSIKNGLFHCSGYETTSFDNETYCNNAGGTWNAGSCSLCEPLGGYWYLGQCVIK